MAAKEKSSSRLSAWLAPLLLLLAAVAVAVPASASMAGALETRAWEKTSFPLESRQLESLQLLDLHQQNESGGYDSALGSPLAAENAAVEAPSSRVLGQNLEDAGITRPADSAAHHIVAGADERAAEARAILQREGIGINEADNGAFLPKNLSVPNPAGAQVHSVLHTDVYYNAVNAALRNAPAGTIRDVLTRIADQLSGGAFPH